MPKRKRKKKPLTLKDVLKANKSGKDLKPKRKQSKYKTESEQAREKLDKLSDKELKAYAEKAFKKTYMRIHRLNKTKNVSTSAKMHIKELSGYINKKGEFDRYKKGLTREKLIDKIIKAEKFSSYQTTSESGNKRQFAKEADKRHFTENQYSYYQHTWDVARKDGLFDDYTESQFQKALDEIFDSNVNFNSFSDFYNAVKEHLSIYFITKQNNFEDVYGDDVFDDEDFDIFGDDYDEPFTNPAFFD